jgi:hypothetical protein
MHQKNKKRKERKRRTDPLFKIMDPELFSGSTPRFLSPETPKNNVVG